MATGARLPAYLDRIGLASAPPCDPAGLATLQRAHRQGIAFENLDIMLGRPIRIDGDSAFAKLVSDRRGGYCFEQNRLYADMLAALGLPTRPLLARVLLGPVGPLPPRTHVLLLASVGGEYWIADAGFGGSYLPPLPLRDGATTASDDGTRHRLRRTGDLGGEWLLERRGSADLTDGRGGGEGEWQPQYAFDLAPVAPADLEQANHWTSTRPHTRFTTFHVVSVVLPHGFASLVDRDLTVIEGVGIEGPGRVTRRVESPAAYADLLDRRFGLDFASAQASKLPVFES